MAAKMASTIQAASSLIPSAAASSLIPSRAHNQYTAEPAQWSKGAGASKRHRQGKKQMSPFLRYSIQDTCRPRSTAGAHTTWLSLARMMLLVELAELALYEPLTPLRSAGRGGSRGAGESRGDDGGGRGMGGGVVYDVWRVIFCILYVEVGSL